MKPRIRTWLSALAAPRTLAACAMACGVAGSALAQAADAPATVAKAAPSVAAVPAGYRVGAGDELNFRFTYTPELNTVAQVRADGSVSLPLLGELVVAGLSLRELAQRVQTALAQRVRRPEVVINVQGNLPSQRVFIGGEVVKPGVQPLAGALTVLQAVMVADGLKDTAQPREVLVLRAGPDGTRVALKLDLKALMEGGEGAQDIALAPYDVVIVPKSGIANVGLWVDQYIRRVLPINLGFSYSINRNGAVLQ
jgi:protein involved in polysaccharide export with SLBB domain